MNRVRVAVPLLALVALAGWVHLSGAGQLLPHRNEPDAYVVYQSNEAFGGPYRGRYPFLLPALHAWVSGSGSPRLPPGSDLASHLEQASAPFLSARRLLVLLSLLAVPGTWWLARRFVDQGAAWLAAALLASSLLFLSYTGQARPHTAVTAFAALAVAGACRLSRRGRWRDHLWAAVPAAAALGSFPSGALVVAPWMVAAWLRLRDDGARGLSRLGVGAVVAALVVAWSYAPSAPPADARSGPPGAAVGPAEPAPLQDVAPQAGNPKPDAASTSGSDRRPATRGAGDGRAAARRRAREPEPADQDLVTGPEDSARAVEFLGHHVYLDLLNGRGFLVLLRALWSHDPVLTAGALLGLIVLALRAARRSAPLAPGRRRELAVLLSFAVPASVLPGMYEASMQRYFLPLLPCVALLAASGLQSACRSLLSHTAVPRSRVLLAAALSLLVLALPAATAWRYVRLRALPDTQTLAARWIMERTELDGCRLFTGVSLPLLQPWSRLMQDAWWAGSAWDRYQRRNRPPSSLSGGHDIRHLTVEEARRAIASGGPARAIEALLAEFRPRLAVIEREPVVDEVPSPYGLQRAIELGVERAGGTPIHLLTPFSGERTGRPGLAYHLGDAAWLDVWRAEALGPALEIHAFPP